MKWILEEIVSPCLASLALVFFAAWLAAWAAGVSP